MTTVIEISGLLEKQLQILVDAGLYSSKTEAVRDAIRRLLGTVGLENIVTQIYSQKKISLAYAAQLIEKPILEVFVKLLGKGITPRFMYRNINIDDIITLIERKKILVFDVSAIYLMYLSESLNILKVFLNNLKMRNIRCVISPETIMHLKYIELKRLISFNQRMPSLALTIENIDTNELRKFRNKHEDSGLSLAELESQYLAKKLNGILVTDEYKAVELAEANRIDILPSLAILEYVNYHKLIEINEYRDASIRMKTLYTFGV